MTTNDIVEQLLNDQYGEFDVDEFLDDSAKVEMFGEMYARYANFKADRHLTHAENMAELHTDIKEYLEKTLTHYVEQNKMGKAA